MMDLATSIHDSHNKIITIKLAMYVCMYVCMYIPTKKLT